MLKTIFILTLISIIIFIIAYLFMAFSRGVRMKGAHAGAEQRRLIRAREKLKTKNQN